MNKGHENLIKDLKSLLEEAEGFQFDDFRNTNYSFPKRTLVEKLERIIMQTKSGQYDN